MSRAPRLAILLHAGPLLLLAGGCSVTTPSSSFPGRVRAAAFDAAADPWSWVPLTGAAVIAAGDQDERISAWARTRNPLFGSPQGALRASDHLRESAKTLSWVTFAAAIDPTEEGWAGDTVRGGGSALTGYALSRNVTGLIKYTARRGRPGGSESSDSMPSAHAADAFSHATVGRHYAEGLPAAPLFRNSVKLALAAYAAGTAWGRVEGGVHYPSDVLVGAAVSNFAARFCLELFGKQEGDWRIGAQVDQERYLVLLQRDL